MLDVLPAFLASPTYTALIFCRPEARVEVLKLPLPVALSVAVPSVVLPSLMLTAPVGNTPKEEVTDTLKVTTCPAFDGFGLALSVVAVMFLMTI